MPKIKPKTTIPVSLTSVAEKQAEAEALFNSMGDGAITTDEFGRITRVNPAAQQILGFSEKELIGEWFPKKIIAVDQSDQPITLIDRPIARIFMTGNAISEKMYYRTKHGRRIPVAVNAAPIIINDRPHGAIETFRDISLEEEVDRMKSEFISLASHQLRTPLSAIKTYTHMLQDGFMGELNADQRKALETIVSASNRMNELISTLLNITRIESGTIAVTYKSVKIDAVIAEVLPELELMAAHKKIDLSMEIKGNNTTIKTDPLIVKEVVTNLVSNAIKYTPEQGSVTIFVRPRKNDLRVEVRDSGWGIPTYSQDQVFSKFFRAHNIVKRETSGTGLGLYLVKGLLEALGGTIWFKSEEGAGTSFFFSLPRAASRKNSR